MSVLCPTPIFFKCGRCHTERLHQDNAERESMQKAGKEDQPQLQARIEQE